jgi:hypothetical protein
MKKVLPIDPAGYQRHPIHGETRQWAETNCYVDIWVELLHAWGIEPIAALPFTVAIDFEGDQWTFFKFPHADLLDLYGLDVQELAIWRPLVTHIEEQVTRGRPVLVELDSYYLPDTAGTAYQRQHVKSTVAVTAIDNLRRQLGYFHGQGYYHLQDVDFVNVFRLREPQDPAQLPPYAEIVKRQPGPPPRLDELVEKSLALLHRHLRRAPQANPFESFKVRLKADLDWLMNEPIDTFHNYSFATLRQFGACYELTATYLQWLQAHARISLDNAIHAFGDLSSGAKALQFQLARTMVRKKPLDLSAIDTLAGKWTTGLQELQATIT